MQSAPTIVHIIDDDSAVRESLEALLVVSGFEVETYGSAEDYLARGDGMDGCIVLDIHMPGMGGLDLLQTPRRPRTPGSGAGAHGEPGATGRGTRPGTRRQRVPDQAGTRSDAGGGTPHRADSGVRGTP